MVGPAFAFLARFFPFHATDAERRRYDELARRYRALTALEILPVAAMAVVTASLWDRALLALWAARAERLAPAAFVVGPSRDYFLLCAAVLGLLSAAPVLHAFLRAVLRERFRDYVLFTNLRVGFDTWKVLRALAVVLGGPALALALLGADAYVVVTEDGIVVNRLFRLAEEAHPFSQVAAIRSARRFRAPSGELRERAHVVIAFADGTRWSTMDWPHDPDPRADAALAEHVAVRSGRTVERVDLAE